MMSIDEIGNALKEITDRNWREMEQPILLSDAAPALALVCHEYRTLLKGDTLKSFIKATGNQYGYRLVEHPTQNAKIGLVPSDSQFEFENLPSDKPQKKNNFIRKNENKAIDLLEILSTLSEEELAKITIPVSILVKLIK